jgi:hypothetical protein
MIVDIRRFAWHGSAHKWQSDIFYPCSCAISQLLSTWPLRNSRRGVPHPLIRPIPWHPAGVHLTPRFQTSVPIAFRRKSGVMEEFQTDAGVVFQSPLRVPISAPPSRSTRNQRRRHALRLRIGHLNPGHGSMARILLSVGNQNDQWSSRISGSHRPAILRIADSCRLERAGDCARRRVAYGVLKNIRFASARRKRARMLAVMIRQ